MRLLRRFPWDNTAVLALPALLTFLSMIAVFLALTSPGWTTVIVILAAAALTYSTLAAIAGMRSRDVPRAPINPSTSTATMIAVVAVLAVIAIGSLVALVIVL